MIWVYPKITPICCHLILQSMATLKYFISNVECQSYAYMSFKMAKVGIVLAVLWYRAALELVTNVLEYFRVLWNIILFIFGGYGRLGANCFVLRHHVFLRGLSTFWSKQYFYGLWHCLNFYVVTDASEKFVAFWPMIFCSVVDDYRCFRQTCCLHLQYDVSKKITMDKDIRKLENKKERFLTVLESRCCL
jgi:hypothetical protein